MNDWPRMSHTPFGKKMSLAEPLQFEFVPRPGLLKLTIVNALLSIVTLGFYRFWGKTRVRQHIWSSVHINGEPLEYTGTGMELFKGFLVVFGTLGLPFVIAVVAISITRGPESVWLKALQGVAAIFIYFFWGYAVYKARKFQLTRTMWRGIRGTLVGSAMKYSIANFGATLARSITLGWATPAMNTILQERIISDMRFGDAAFKFQGRSGPLYKSYAASWLLNVVLYASLFGIVVYAVSHGMLNLEFGPDNRTFPANGWKFVALILVLFVTYMLLLPFIWSIYMARELQLFAEYTRFDGAQFRLNATRGSMVWLTIVNFLITVLTLGFGRPFVQRRQVRYVIDRLELFGSVDIDRIMQSPIPMESRGEGLADAFDVGGL